MAVILERSTGETLRLGCEVGGAFVPSFHVAGWSDTSDVPGTVYPGYDGEEVDERAVRVSARSYTVRGWLRGETPQELEQLVDSLQGWVNTREALQLRRHEDDDKFVLVRKVSFAHDYVFKSGRTRCNVSMTFKAADPYRYAVDEELFEEEITEFREPLHLLEITNCGTTAADPVIVIAGRTIEGVHTQNPQLRSYKTGRVASYNGELKQDELLILDTAKRRAWKLAGTVDTAGPALGGDENMIALAVTASEADSAYAGQIIRVVGGTGEGQVRRIVGYHGASRTATVGAPWDTVPDATSQYEIYRAALLPGRWISEAQHGDFSGAIDATASMNDGYIIYGFPLGPGLNQIEVEGDTEHLKVSVAYRARWY